MLMSHELVDAVLCYPHKHPAFDLTHRYSQPALEQGTPHRAGRRLWGYATASSPSVLGQKEQNHYLTIVR